MSDPLSEEEVAAVRLIIETDKRRVWLMSNIRSIASWIVIVLGGIAVSWDAIQRAVKSMLGD
tara:strand:- start:30695 stop:30880 length:186 start_codon:yes stop_codon:yes gene_type:complete